MTNPALWVVVALAIYVYAWFARHVYRAVVEEPEVARAFAELERMPGRHKLWHAKLYAMSIAATWPIMIAREIYKAKRARRGRDEVR